MNYSNNVKLILPPELGKMVNIIAEYSKTPKTKVIINLLYVLHGNPNFLKETYPLAHNVLRSPQLRDKIWGKGE